MSDERAQQANRIDAIERCATGILADRRKPNAVERLGNAILDQVKHLKREHAGAQALRERSARECDTCRRLQEKLELNAADHLAAMEKADQAHGVTVDQRDRAEEWADKLAYAIASEDVIGEHSNLNNPWENALEQLEILQGAPVRPQEKEDEKDLARLAQPQLRAGEADPRADQWRPIETAPKDGTLVLLWMRTGYQDIGKWFQGSPSHIGWWNVRAIAVEPTHWMPLPSPPQEPT